VPASSGKILAFLNDDAVAGPGWLGAATEALSDESIAAGRPKVVLTTRYREIRYPTTIGQHRGPAPAWTANPLG